MTGEPEEVGRETGAEVRTFIQRADLLDDLGHFAEAAEELRDALRLEPDNPEALATLGMVELRAGRAEQALVPARAALAVRPDHLLGQAVCGYALVALERGADAVDVARTMLDADPGSWLRQLHFAAIVRRVRNGQATLDAAWQAVRLAPDEPETHLVLAAVAGDLGLVDIARRAHAEAVRLDPRAADDTPPAVLRLRPSRSSGRPPPDEADAEPPVPRRGVRSGMARFLAVGALYSWGAPLVVALSFLAGETVARIVAGGLALGGVVLFGTFRAHPPTGPVPVLRLLGRLDRLLAAAGAAVLAAPPMLLVFAALGSPWPLGVLILVGAFAFAALVLRTDDLGRPGSGT